MEIRGFEGKYEFLSNFFIHPMEMTVGSLRLRFRCSETAYHMFKLFGDWKNPTQEEMYRAREFASDAITPGRAKRQGRRIPIDAAYWDSVKSDVMYEVLKAKFADPRMLQMLLDTGDAYLEETNTWGDRYWGVCDGAGENTLGRLLMKLRKEKGGR